MDGFELRVGNRFTWSTNVPKLLKYKLYMIIKVFLKELKC